MTEPHSTRTVSGQMASLEPDEPSPDTENSPALPQTSNEHHRLPRRVSFSISRHSLLRSRGTIGGEGIASDPPQNKPAIPSALEGPDDGYATPLPVLSMIVLSITLLGEFLSANVSAPFILFMVEGFGQLTDEADVGYWTGILVSVFFLTQFLTSLLWATIAAKYGSRIVICIALFGSSVTLLLFGLSTSLQQAIAIRLMQGVFAGAVGVARGCVAGITDQSNEGRAYAILGFCWGLGGVAGAIVGGTFETPVNKWPGLFSELPIFVTHPYLLPCAVAASITLAGSVVSLFLGPDCEPRQPVTRLYEKPPVAIQNSTPQATFRSRPISRPSIPDISTYVYSNSQRNRSSSAATRRGSRAVSIGRRRDSVFDGDVPQSSVGIDLNLAQRILMANENTVSNIADLWVASAITTDNADPTATENDFESGQGDAKDYGTFRNTDDLDMADGKATAPVQQVTKFFPRSDSITSFTSLKLSRRSSLIFESPRRAPSSIRVPFRRYASIESVEEGTSQTYQPNVLPIFAHTGVRPPPAVLEAQLQQFADEYPEEEDLLPPIMEGQQVQVEGEQRTESLEEREPSLVSLLPILVIVQYGFLALHTTTHDQVFYLYLVSKYPSGGLNLNAGHFSQLIAMMCLAQIAYQFYLYPNIGPPRGRFSHLSMFRIGSLLFIPSYLSVTLYRAFASPTDDGNLLLMTALAISTALRFCGQTFTFTAISVLLNYMSPPHVVGYANGIAQSIASLARFVGPILGGTLWSISVNDNPSGYSLGFIACAGVCGLAVAHSLLIR